MQSKSHRNAHSMLHRGIKLHLYLIKCEKKETKLCLCCLRLLFSYFKPSLRFNTSNSARARNAGRKAEWDALILNAAIIRFMPNQRRKCIMHVFISSLSLYLSLPRSLHLPFISAHVLNTMLQRWGLILIQSSDKNGWYGDSRCAVLSSFNLPPIISMCNFPLSISHRR